ncbi:MAG TPA: peptidase M42 [Firmicutes bacterium]|nr:peptidase M42 [Bacillota bacterium]
MFLKELSELSGVSGNEDMVRDFIRGKLSAWGIHHDCDALGNLYAYKGDGATGAVGGLMLAAHMDEVGLMVSAIEKCGHLRFYKVGGIDEQFLVSCPVYIGSAGISGVIGAKAVHLQKKEERGKLLEVDKLYIDIGAKDKDDAAKVIKVGDYVSFAARTATFADTFKGKALDNRAGCAALLEILQRDFPGSFTAVFTVQEEIGCRGARAAAYRLNPRMALVVETTIAADLPDVEEKDQVTLLGKGPAFTLQDDSLIAHPRILERLMTVAQEQNISCQFRRFTGSSTDGGAVTQTREGVPAGVISTPCRYLHGPASLLCLADWRNVVEVVDGFINSVLAKGL